MTVVHLIRSRSDFARGLVWPKSKTDYICYPITKQRQSNRSQTQRPHRSLYFSQLNDWRSIEVCLAGLVVVVFFCTSFGFSRFDCFDQKEIRYSHFGNGTPLTETPRCAVTHFAEPQFGDDFFLLLGPNRDTCKTHSCLCKNLDLPHGHTLLKMRHVTYSNRVD